MKKLQQIVENTTWHTQFLYGLILALFFGGATLLSSFHPVWALVQILAVAVLREYYMDFAFLSWSWRNFFFLQIPAFLIYIFLTF
jgi:hypothetical protein